MTGHRPKREGASDAKFLAELKRENHLLKRKLARAEKMVQQFLDREFEAVEDEAPAATEAKVQPKENGCPSCGSALKSISFGTKTLNACKECGWRKVTG